MQFNIFDTFFIFDFWAHLDKRHRMHAQKIKMHVRSCFFPKVCTLHFLSILLIWHWHIIGIILCQCFDQHANTWHSQVRPLVFSHPKVCFHKVIFNWVHELLEDERSVSATVLISPVWVKIQLQWCQFWLTDHGPRYLLNISMPSERKTGRVELYPFILT